jgi:DNA-binding CsgD family transcriptional regulator
MKVFLSFSQSDRPFAELLGSNIRALGTEVVSEDAWLEPGVNLDEALRSALETSVGVVLVVPKPGSPKANNAFFEAGAARALGKPVVAVIPSPDPSRARELPPDVFGLAAFDGSRIAPKSLANSVVTTLKAAHSRLERSRRSHVDTGDAIPLEDVPDRHSPLTDRELAVIRAIHLGKSTKLIAHELDVGLALATTYVRNVFDKLGAKTRAEVVIKTGGFSNTQTARAEPGEKGQN